MIIAALIVLGLCFGSFVNALVWRFHEQAELAEKGQKKTKKGSRLTKRQLSMVQGRSMCSTCHHELATKDLIPLFSWLMLRGKCRYCKAPIQDSPLVELLLPIVYVVSYLVWPVTLTGLGLYQFIFWLIFLIGFAALVAYDMRWYILPDRIVLPLIGLAVVELIGELVFFHAGWPTLLGAFWGVLIGSGIFYALYVASNGSWIGGGDVKLGFVLGLLVGGPSHSILLIFIASLAGSLLAIPLMAMGKAGRHTRLPFGPYLLFAAVIVVLWGAAIIHGYKHLFGLA